MNRAVIFLLGMMVLAVSPVRAQPADGPGAAGDCQPRQVSGKVSLSASASQVLALIVSPDTDPAERTPVLENYLAQPGQDAESVDFVLRNYARMTLGADYMQAGQFEQARAILSKVRLDSPAGVETALLIARSYHMQGDRASALKWFVRVGERYPANPGVLQYLLEAAAMAEESNPRLAAGIYERALKKALANVEDLASLRKDVAPLSNILVEFPKDAGTTVGGQVVRDILRSRQQALPHLRHVLNTTEKLACLEMELKAIDEKLFQVTERGARIGSFQTMMERERKAMNERLAALEQQLEQAYLSSEKQRIRDELEHTRARLETMNQRQAELERQRREKTQGPQQARRELEQRQQALSSYLQENRAAIEKELDQVIADLRKHYLDLAGEGQMGKARMMREIAVRDTR